MNTSNLFLAASETVKPDPLSALIAAAAISAIFIIFLLIKKRMSSSKADTVIQAQPAVEPTMITEAKHEPIHFYKPEEIGVDDGELIAVLTAAIVAATGKSSSSFRVVSFRKKGDWAGNALRELINK